MTTSQLISNHLLKNGVSWHPLSESFNDYRQACVDGREHRPVIGTPGGDMGILLLMISAGEKVLNREFSESEIREIFYRYIDEFGVFYYHSDKHALHHLAEALNHESCFALQLADDLTETELVEIVNRLIRKPLNSQQREVLLEYIVKTDNIGCGHLKLASKHPNEYQVRQKVIEVLIQAFFQETWHWGKTDFVVLEGGHAEKLVLNVHLDPVEELVENTLVPAVLPFNKQTSVKGDADEYFINHPEIIDAIYRHNAIVMINKKVIPDLTPLRLEAFLAEVRRLGTLQLMATLKYLAPKLEIWNVVLAKIGQKTKILELKKA